MPSKFRRAMILVALIASTTFPAAQARGGALADMLARRRMQRQLQAQTQPKLNDNPFHGRAVGGSLVPPSLAQRFQSRFPTKRTKQDSAPSGSMSRSMKAMDRF